MKTAKPWWRRIWDTLTGEPATGSKVPTQKTTPKMPPVKPAKAEPYVFTTMTGKKYHYSADCPALQNAWAHNEAIKMGLSKAHAAGRQPCSKCGYTFNE